MPAHPIPALVRGAACAGVAVLCTLGVAHAQSGEPYFKGNSITINVAGTAGGLFDVMTRTLADHYGRHLPGNPAIVVKDQPGGGGIVAGNSLNNLSVIQKNIAKASQTPGAQPPASKEAGAQGPEKKFIIDRLTISGAQATVALPQVAGAAQMLGQDANASVTLPTIDMRDLGAKEGGLPPAKIAEQVMARIEQQAKEAVGSNAQRLLDKVGSGASGVLNQGSSGAGDLGGQLKGLLGR